MPPDEYANHLHDGHDIDCADCARTDLIADAGARVICAAAGADWDAITDTHVKAHYKVIASEVMAAMSQAMLDLAVAKEKARG